MNLSFCAGKNKLIAMLTFNVDYSVKPSNDLVTIIFDKFIFLLMKGIKFLIQ